MRFVVFGAGAIGGVVGARLHQAGGEVVLLARGQHLRAIHERGLTLEEPEGRSALRLPAFAGPDELDWHGDEIVLLATKSQDTLGAVQALRAVAPSAAVVCMQNGVANERIALRRNASVYGAVVMLPAAHLEPGVVQAYGTELTGVVDVGRYPDGLDERCEAVCAALERARFDSQPRPDIMRFKYAKLLLNLGNAVEALCEPGPEADALSETAEREGRAVLRAAGIDFVAEGVGDVSARWQRIGVKPIAGQRRAGSSTWQSLARGASGIETDYLNGEVVLLGRLHGVPTPVNEALCELAVEAVRERRAPRAVGAEDVRSRARALGSATPP